VENSDLILPLIGNLIAYVPCAMACFAAMVLEVRNVQNHD